MNDEISEKNKQPKFSSNERVIEKKRPDGL